MTSETIATAFLSAGCAVGGKILFDWLANGRRKNGQHPYVTAGELRSLEGRVERNTKLVDELDDRSSSQGKEIGVMDEKLTNHAEEIRSIRVRLHTLANDLNRLTLMEEFRRDDKGGPKG